MWAVVQIWVFVFNNIIPEETNLQKVAFPGLSFTRKVMLRSRKHGVGKQRSRQAEPTATSRGDHLYKFGYGLSYTTFACTNLSAKQNYATNAPINIAATVTNTGKYDGEEVVQLYIKHKNASVPVPPTSLKGFERISLKKGETKTVSFNLSSADFSIINNDGKQVVAAGEYEINIGGGQPGNHTIKKTIKLTGREIIIK